MPSATASAPVTSGPESLHTQRRIARTGMLVTSAFVSLTALAGGLALITGALFPQLATVFSPPGEYLVGTPFSSYLVPGLMLALVVGGVHAAAFMLELRRSTWHLFGGAAAGFCILIWVFVQMMFIPFSFLQAVYFVAGLAEVGFVMLALGVTRRSSR